MTYNKALKKKIERFHAHREDLIREICEQNGLDYQRIVDKEIPQSTLFMSEIIRYLHDLCLHFPERTYKSALDVGPLSFAGTALLSTIHKPRSFNRMKLHVSAIDITDKFLPLKDILAPDVRFIKGNIFDVDETWDIVIASHVIEHVPDPEKFARRLQEIARDFVIIACPWREDPLVTPGHINTIDKAFTLKIGARGLQIFTNYSWGKDREVCIFWLPGKAK